MSARISSSVGTAIFWISGSHSVPLRPGRRTSQTTITEAPKLMRARASAEYLD